jgi:hypothetical protein
MDVAVTAVTVHRCRFAPTAGIEQCDAVARQNFVYFVLRKNLKNPRKRAYLHLPGEWDITNAEE